MAVDSAVKRYSILNFDIPWFWLLPAPTGGFGREGRQHLLGRYSGISTAVGIAPVLRRTSVADGTQLRKTSAADPSGLRRTTQTEPTGLRRTSE